MNVYDFDKTIFDGDSTFRFYMFCVKKKKSLLWGLWAVLFPFAFYLLGFMTKTKFKERLYKTFLPKIDAEALLPEFWEENYGRIKKFYLERQREDDVIISASPLFIVKPCCDRLGIKHLYASNVDPKTGIYDGENCHGEEKVRRFEAAGFNKEDIEEFYSDSLSDTPLALLAKNAYVVTGEKLERWDDYKLPLGKKIVRVFIEPRFFRFAICGCINTVTCVIFSFIASELIPKFELKVMTFVLSNILVSHLTGYYLSISLSYFLNSLFSFRKKLSVGRYFKFIASYIPNYIVQMIVVFLTVDLLGLPRIAGLILAAAIGAPVTFLCMKFFAFRK